MKITTVMFILIFSFVLTTENIYAQQTNQKPKTQKVENNSENNSTVNNSKVNTKEDCFLYCKTNCKKDPKTCNKNLRALENSRALENQENNASSSNTNSKNENSKNNSKENSKK